MEKETKPKIEKVETRNSEQDSGHSVRVCYSCGQPIKPFTTPGVPGTKHICINQNCYRFGLDTVIMVTRPLSRQELQRAKETGQTPTALPQPLMCPECSALYTAGTSPQLRMGALCPRCGEGVLDMPQEGMELPPPWGNAKVDETPGDTRLVHCTRCGWQGKDTDQRGDIGNCPNCGASWSVTETHTVKLPTDEDLKNALVECPVCKWEGIRDISKSGPKCPECGALLECQVADEPGRADQEAQDEEAK